MEFLCNLSDIHGIENKRFVIGKQPILLCYSESKYYAFIDQCPHAMKSMEGGKIKNGKLFCPLHGASFLLETGEVKSPPAFRGLKKLDLELKQEKIYVKI
jgi:3-phenylpropionate/trans-cinnamate dioxygenase ferredoxin component